MHPLLHTRQPATQAILAGFGFALYAFAVHLAAPWKIFLAATVFAVAIGAMAYRRSRGASEVPDYLIVSGSILALALYSWGFLIRRTPQGLEWIAVALIFLVPLLLLGRVYNRRRQRRLSARL
jgi:hypothetical protein